MNEHQESLDFDAPDSNPPTSGAVTCLGMSFENDEARRAHFTEELRKKLQDPEFRKIEGFPIGSDQDILALSDPPYYTACPNPWIADFIAEWEAQKPKRPEGDQYHREPFAADVSEGKNDPIYNAHSYHTKVPHKAIMRYILHYTQPGDIVFDFFCGTGMTGLAAQECANLTSSYKDIAEDMHKVDPGSRHYKSRKWANSQNSQLDLQGRVNFFVWAERFICPNCSGEFPISNVIDLADAKTPPEFTCPHCSSSATKRTLIRVMETTHDALLNKTITQVKRDLVLINYTYQGKRYEKWPDDNDRALAEKINSASLPRSIPLTELPHGERRMKDAYDNIGIKYVHNFYFYRTLQVLGKLAERINEARKTRDLLAILFTSQLINLSVMNRFRRVSFPYNPMSGTFYVGSIISEANPFDAYRNKISRFVTAKKGRAALSTVVGTQSATDSPQISANSIDYIFIDPPFGRNLHYSELNFIWEAWLGLQTERAPEAVMDKGRQRELLEYATLMRRCFKEGYRVLKPGRWMTVEFHNSSNAVWNAIQESLLMAGFVIADVRTLDKQGETYKQSQQGLVKADLIISAYKPTEYLERTFAVEAGTEKGVWDFVRDHLKHLPVFVAEDNRMEPNAERMRYLLFDRMVAFHVQHGVTVPLNSSEFYAGLEQRFSVREEMYFLPDQAIEFDKRRITVTGIQQTSLFVNDEASAIQWLRQLIKEKPQSKSDINPQFMEQLRAYSKNEKLLELLTLLEQNFLCYDGKSPVPEQIHAYLSTNWKELRNLPKDDPALVAKARDRWYVPDPNKAGDLEKLREKALLKEFEEYKEVKMKLKVFRLEAVRAGFKKAWQERDYAVIVAVADKIPNNVLEEDPKLLMWYDQAVTRMGAG